jgi:hypothetical protein
MKLTNKKTEKLGEVIFAFTDDFGSTPYTGSVGFSCYAAVQVISPLHPSGINTKQAHARVF